MTSSVSYLFASLKKDFKSDGPLKKSTLRGRVSASDLLKLREGVIFTRDSFSRSGCRPRWFWIRTAQIQETRKGYLWSFRSSRTMHCPHPAAPLRESSLKGTGPSTSALLHTAFPWPSTVWAEPLLLLRWGTFSLTFSQSLKALNKISSG